MKTSKPRHFELNHGVVGSAVGPRGRVSESLRSHNGYSVIELLVVVALIGVLTALAIPQIVASKRLTRSIAMTREIVGQIRLARQEAMSQRQAFTFQYNNLTKRISIIDHNVNSGPALLIDPTYPNTPGSVVTSSIPLSTGGLIASEISYGIPAGVPATPLRDGTSMTPLLNNVIHITFQPDGSVINAAGNPSDVGFFIYNNSSARGTASAISVLGASGRVKIWRYDRNANVYGD